MMVAIYQSFAEEHEIVWFDEETSSAYVWVVNFSVRRKWLVTLFLDQLSIRRATNKLPNVANGTRRETT